MTWIMLWDCERCVKAQDCGTFGELGGGKCKQSGWEVSARPPEVKVRRWSCDCHFLVPTGALNPASSFHVQVVKTKVPVVRGMTSPVSYLSTESSLHTRVNAVHVSARALVT